MGHYPSMNLAEARKKFLELRELRRSGQNPKQMVQQQKTKEQMTVKQLVSSWYTNYIERHRKQPLQIKKHIEADIIPLLGNFHAETLETRDISQALDKIVKRGSPIHANKVLSTLKQAFNYAVNRGELKLNPASSIRGRDIGGIEKPRERYLSPDEIKTLWLFLDGNDNKISLQIINAIKILLLTGVRTGELWNAKWSEFDFENHLWSIPAENTKTNLIMRIHLTKKVTSLLQELHGCSISEFVLSGADGLKQLSDRALPKAVKRMQDRVGIPHWTAHDLRRTFATQLGHTLQVDPVVIEKCLGHKMPKIMATYNKNEMLPQRKVALEQWRDFIDRLVCKQNTFSDDIKNLLSQNAIPIYE